jgi:hypothetical protein
LLFLSFEHDLFRKKKKKNSTNRKLTILLAIDASPQRYHVNILTRLRRKRTKSLPLLSGGR